MKMSTISKQLNECGNKWKNFIRIWKHLHYFHLPCADLYKSIYVCVRGLDLLYSSAYVLILSFSWKLTPTMCRTEEWGKTRGIMCQREKVQKKKMFELTFHFEICFEKPFLSLRSYWIHLTKMRPYCVHFNIIHHGAHVVCLRVFLQLWFLGFTPRIPVFISFQSAYSVLGKFLPIGFCRKITCIRRCMCVLIFTATTRTHTPATLRITTKWIDDACIYIHKWRGEGGAQSEIMAYSHSKF